MSRQPRARFITLEGIDGAGKSSHVESLAARLRDGGGDVVVTREPGGTPLAEALRAHLLNDAMDPVAETLLMFAARRDHVRSVIAPALARGAVVLCDRFTDATFAYQGGGRGVDLTLLAALEASVQTMPVGADCDGGSPLQPDLTLWFDLPAAVAAERRMAARRPDRFEQLDVAFFERVRAGYAARAEAAPQRIVCIDASQSREAVWSQIEQALAAHGW